MKRMLHSIWHIKISWWLLVPMTIIINIGETKIAEREDNTSSSFRYYRGFMEKLPLALVGEKTHFNKFLLSAWSPSFPGSRWAGTLMQRNWEHGWWLDPALSVSLTSCHFFFPLCLSSNRTESCVSSTTCWQIREGMIEAVSVSTEHKIVQICRVTTNILTVMFSQLQLFMWKGK